MLIFMENIMHPLDIFKFCPKCGSSKFPINSPTSKKCEVCGFEYFKNPSIGVAAVVFDEQGRLMVTRRSREPAKGTLDLPGGFVNINETIEEAVIREVKEETNIDIEVVEYLFDIPNTYIYSGMDCSPLDFMVECKITNMDNIQIDKSENSELIFLKPEEINPQDFGLESIRKAIEKIIFND